MQDQEPNIINKFIRIFPGKGKKSVPTEESIDKVVPGKYDPKVEDSKTKNQIDKSRNYVWIIGGVGILALVLALPIYLTAQVGHFASLLASDLDDSQAKRIENVYNNAREDRNDLVQMIIPGLLTVITVGIFQINRASSEKSPESGQEAEEE